MEENQEKCTSMMLITPQKYLLTTLHTNFQVLAVSYLHNYSEACYQKTLHSVEFPHNSQLIGMESFCVSISKDHCLGQGLYFPRCKIKYSYSSDLLTYVAFLQFYDCLADVLQLSSWDLVCSI